MQVNEKDTQILVQSGLRFIEAMTASAMHEVKNKLAIINENSGLIQDLSWMAQKKDQPLDIGRMESISGKIQDQVRFADDIIKKVNQFSGGLDTSETEVNLADALTFTLALADQLIEKMECRIHLVSPASPVTVRIRLFYLENLFWRILESVCTAADPGSRISVTIDPAGSSPVVTISSEDEIIRLDSAILDSDEVKALSRFLSVHPEMNNDSKSIRLVWGN